MFGTQEYLVSSVLDVAASCTDSRQVSAVCAERLGQLFRVSRCVVIPYSDTEPVSANPAVEWSLDPPEDRLNAVSLSLANFLADQLANRGGVIAVNDVYRETSLAKVYDKFHVLGIKSFCAVSLRHNGSTEGTILFYDCDSFRIWSDADLVMIRSLCSFLGAVFRHVRLQAAERLSSQRENAGTTGLVLYDLHGRFLAASQSFELVTEVARASLRGKTVAQVVDELVVPEHRQEMLRFFEFALQQQKAPQPAEFSVLQRERHLLKWLRQELRPIVDEKNQLVGFEGEFSDISHERTAEDKYRKSEARYRRLVEHSDAVIFHTDPRHAITFISRRSLDFFGIAPEDVISGGAFVWYQLIHPEDVERVSARVAESERAQKPFDEEFRVINRVTGKVRWLLVRLVPVWGETRLLEGWDGFGVDITERREAQQALEVQSRKVRALYTVSSAIRGYLEPSNIAARGLRALCDATGAGAGVCYLYTKEKSQKLNLVAHYGFTEGFDNSIEQHSNLASLSSFVAQNSQSVVVPDIRHDPRTNRFLAENEGQRAAVLVPISVEDETLGTLGLFSKHVNRFDGGDVMLVSAAANQIGLAARQANLFSAYRRQANKLAALYRLSHELSRNLSLDDIFQHAFSILRDELGLKRLWLGLLDETGTSVIGQAAYGQGWKRQLVEINVEIKDHDHPIAQVVRSRAPQVISSSSRALKEFGLKKIFSRLGIDAVALVPLLASGQVLGVLGVQSMSDDSQLSDDELTLLSSLANEIAVIILTKRLEERIAESEKMRTAGLLAAGIAHNFNNLLQAVMGQASLLELQGSKDARTEKAVRVINEASKKGAELVNQLMSFAHLDEPRKEACDVNELIERAKGEWVSYLNEKIELKLTLAPDLSLMQVDPRQLRRLISSLIRNSADALASGGVIEVFTDNCEVDREHLMYEVPFGKYVRVGVRDDGSGMDDETKRRCFEPFFTTKNVDKASGLGMTGAGLGLAAAYAMARRNGGRLVVDSRLGQGSTFTMYGPVAKADEKKVYNLTDITRDKRSAAKGGSRK